MKTLPQWQTIFLRELRPLGTLPGWHLFHDAIRRSPGPTLPRECPLTCMAHHRLSDIFLVNQQFEAAERIGLTRYQARVVASTADMVQKPPYYSDDFRRQMLETLQLKECIP